jgi:hypothetical protein
MTHKDEDPSKDPPRLILLFDIMLRPFGLDIGRLGGIVLDLGPQPSYMHVNGPRLNERLVLPYGIEELFAAEHPAFFSEKQRSLNSRR